jgi:hypothetical protein
LLSHSLGRLVEHDPASWGFAHPEPEKLVEKTTLWEHKAPVLDQGRVGSCTGNALTQCLNTEFFTQSRSEGEYLDEAEAIQLYSDATHLDSKTGTYPPDDRGSSGLAVCKAGEAAGFLSAYHHAFTFTAFLSALQTQPMIVGTSFYEGMETPDKDGLVWPTGVFCGGHEYCVLGVDYENDWFTFLNSWSDTWGLNGRFRMRINHFAILLADQGDAIAPKGVA